MKAGFIDPEIWVCPTNPCPAVVWGRLVHRNRGHLTVSFPRTQWGRMKRAILRELRTRGADQAKSRAATSGIRSMVSRS